MVDGEGEAVRDVEGRVGAGGRGVEPGEDRGGEAAPVGVGHIPGTTTVNLADGSVGRFVVHPTVLLAHTVRLQGAVDDLRRAAQDEEFWGDVEQYLNKWGV